MPVSWAGILESAQPLLSDPAEAGRVRAAQRLGWRLLGRSQPGLGHVAGILAVVLARDLIVTVRPKAIRSETVGSRATFDRRSQVAGAGGTLSAKLGVSVVMDCSLWRRRTARIRKVVIYLPRPWRSLSKRYITSAAWVLT